MFENILTIIASKKGKDLFEKKLFPAKIFTEVEEGGGGELTQKHKRKNQSSENVGIKPESAGMRSQRKIPRKIRGRVVFTENIGISSCAPAGCKLQSIFISGL